MTLGLFGGAFDPPHAGHVALLDAAKRELGLDRVIVIVAADPGHKRVDTPAAERLELVRAAFPHDEVMLDDHPRTIDMLRAHPEWHGAYFLIGADEYAAFESWKEPDEVRRLVQLAVAVRPGSPRPEGIRSIELEEPAASRDVRARLEAGDDVGDVIPAAVRGIIDRDGLYGRPPSYTESA